VRGPSAIDGSGSLLINPPTTSLSQVTSSFFLGGLNRLRL